MQYGKQSLCQFLLLHIRLELTHPCYQPFEETNITQAAMTRWIAMANKGGERGETRWWLISWDLTNSRFVFDGLTEEPGTYPKVFLAQAILRAHGGGCVRLSKAGKWWTPWVGVFPDLPFRSLRLTTRARTPGLKVIGTSAGLSKDSSRSPGMMKETHAHTSLKWLWFDTVAWCVP